jgi:hypothetical protein
MGIKGVMRMLGSINYVLSNSVVFIKIHNQITLHFLPIPKLLVDFSNYNRNSDSAFLNILIKVTFNYINDKNYQNAYFYIGVLSKYLMILLFLPYKKQGLI